MSSYVGYRDGGLTNEQGLKEELKLLFTPGVALGDLNTAFQVSQRFAGVNNSVDVAVGGGLFQRPDGLYDYVGWTDAVTNVSGIAANGSNPRIDALVAYIDLSVTSTSSANNPGALKFKTVAGTAAGSPVPPTDSAIQSNLGTGIPWLRLSDVLMAAGNSNMLAANITDRRVQVAVKANLWGGSSNTKGHTVPNIADGTVIVSSDTATIPAQLLAPTAIRLGRGVNTSTAVVTAGAAEATIASVSVTVPNGGRSLELTGYIPNLSDAGPSGATIGTFRIWKDAVGGSGTQLQQRIEKWQGSDQHGINIEAEDSAPSAGSHTYYLTAFCSPSNLQYNVSATAPATIKAKLV